MTNMNKGLLGLGIGLLVGGIGYGIKSLVDSSMGKGIIGVGTGLVVGTIGCCAVKISQVNRAKKKRDELSKQIVRIGEGALLWDKATMKKEIAKAKELCKEAMILHQKFDKDISELEKIMEILKDVEGNVLKQG